MASKFFSLASSLAMSGHPVAQQGKQGGPDTVRSVGIIFDRSRQLFQAVFFEDGLDTSRLAQDVERAGYHLYTVLPLHVCDPDPGSYPIMRELLRTATPPPAAAEPSRPAAPRKPRSAERKQKAEETIELLRQLLVL